VHLVRVAFWIRSSYKLPTYCSWPTHIFNSPSRSKSTTAGIRCRFSSLRQQVTYPQRLKKLFDTIKQLFCSRSTHTRWRLFLTATSFLVNKDEYINCQLRSPPSLTYVVSLLCRLTPNCPNNEITRRYQDVFAAAARHRSLDNGSHRH